VKDVPVITVLSAAPRGMSTPPGRVHPGRFRASLAPLPEVMAMPFDPARPTAPATHPATPAPPAPVPDPVGGAFGFVGWLDRALARL